MSFLSGIMKSVINPMTIAQLAMGPAGWASLAARMIIQAVGQQVIQLLGQKLGLPQGMIDIAKTAFSASTGGVNGQTIGEAVQQATEGLGFSPMQQGQIARDMSQKAENIAEKLFQASREGSERAKTDGAKDGKTGKGNWLRAIAEVMAASMDKKIEEMQQLAQAYDSQSKDNKSTKTMTDLQVATQEFSYLMQSTTNMIKTIGEGLSTMARKG
jgi:isopenicillin N synthase-like dioxygenase